MALVNHASPVLDHCQTLWQCSSNSKDPSSFRGVAARLRCYRLSVAHCQISDCKPNLRRRATAVCGVTPFDTAEVNTESSQWEAESWPFKEEEVEAMPRQMWNTATVLKVEDLASEVRCITVEAECSREIVMYYHSYLLPGQLAQVKVNGGELVRVSVSSPPISLEANKKVLYKLRGDIPTGTTKVRQYTLSVKAPVDLHVTKQDGLDVFNLKVGDKIELGPFPLTAIDLQPAMPIARYPTLVIFAAGKGIAVARSIIEAKDGDSGSLSFDLREEIRLFYSAPTPSLLLYKERFKQWEEKKVKVCLTVDAVEDEIWNGHVGTLSQLWDADDLDYDPEATVAVVCIEENIEEVDMLLADAGIPEEQIAKWDPIPCALMLHEKFIDSIFKGSLDS